jgi:signal peptidase I
MNRSWIYTGAGLELGWLPRIKTKTTNRQSNNKATKGATASSKQTTTKRGGRPVFVSFTMITDMVNKQIYELKKLWKNKRQLTFQVLNLAMIVFSALMIWKGLMVMTKSESPVVVVLSGSMEPAFQRGDILFLNNAVHDVQVGDTVVFKIKDRDIPIVHRILKVHQDDVTGEYKLLTKGDNNRVDDRGLYAPGQKWLSRDDVLGKAVGALRYVGMVTIALNDYPVLKYVLVGLMGLFVLTSKEG